jgi:hypothetical protein
MSRENVLGERRSIEDFYFSDDSFLYTAVLENILLSMDICYTAEPLQQTVHKPEPFVDAVEG